MNLIELKKCPLCENEIFNKIYFTKDRHYKISGNYQIVECCNCNLVFLNPMPTEAYLSTLYPTEYYSYYDLYPNQNLFKKIYRTIFLNIKTKEPKFNKKGDMLDIGCGCGKFLLENRKKRWNVYGVELSGLAANFGNEKEKLNIFSGNLLQAKFEDAKFDYIRANHSVEHINNPNEVLKEIYRILKNDGIGLIGVPNINSFTYKIFKKYWYYLGAPVHTFNYSNITLKKMLEKHNFKIVKIKYNGDFSGILGSFQIYLNRNNNKISFEGFFIKNIFFKILAQFLARLLNIFKIGDVVEITFKKNDI